MVGSLPPLKRKIQERFKSTFCHFVFYCHFLNSNKTKSIRVRACLLACVYARPIGAHRQTIICSQLFRLNHFHTQMERIVSSTVDRSRNKEIILEVQFVYVLTPNYFAAAAAAAKPMRFTALLIFITWPSVAILDQFSDYFIQNSLLKWLQQETTAQTFLFLIYFLNPGGVDMGFLHLWASIIAAALNGCERTTSLVPTIALVQLCMRFHNRFNEWVGYLP